MNDKIHIFHQREQICSMSLPSIYMLCVKSVHYTGYGTVNNTTVVHLMCFWLNPRKNKCNVPFRLFTHCAVKN